MGNSLLRWFTTWTYEGVALGKVRKVVYFQFTINRPGIMMKKCFFFLGLYLFLILVTAFTKGGKILNFSRLSFLKDTTILPVIHARDHLGQSAFKTSGFVGFTTGLDNDYYYADSSNRTGYLYIETK